MFALHSATLAGGGGVSTLAGGGVFSLAAGDEQNSQPLHTFHLQTLAALFGLQDPLHLATLAGGGGVSTLAGGGVSSLAAGEHGRSVHTGLMS